MTVSFRTALTKTHNAPSNDFVDMVGQFINLNLKYIANYNTQELAHAIRNAVIPAIPENNRPIPVMQHKHFDIHFTPKGGQAMMCFCVNNPAVRTYIDGLKTPEDRLNFIKVCGVHPYPFVVKDGSEILVDTYFHISNVTIDNDSGTGVIIHMLEESK